MVAVRRQSMPRIRDVSAGMRFTTLVSSRRTLVEVVYVRPKRFGDARIVLRRADTGAILQRARSIAELTSLRG